MRNPREDSVPFSVALTRRSGALLLLTLLVAAVLALPYLDALGFIVRAGARAGGGPGVGAGAPPPKKPPPRRNRPKPTRTDPAPV